MKQTTIRIAAFAVILLGAGITKASAQSTAQASASATIITPITITKTTDMNFGNVAVQAGTGGNVVMTPAGVRTASSGVTLPTTQGTVAAASFTIAGQSGYTYAITLPSGNVPISDGNSHSMNVNTFTSNPSGTGTLTGGTQTLNIGATLVVAAGQAPGAYTTGTPFDVTVNYN